MSHEIQTLVQTYLDKCNREIPGMSDEILDQAARDFRDALDRRFNQPPRNSDEFRLSLSKVGRPTCQLQLEEAGAEQEEKPYSFHMQMLIGDMIEAASVAILKASGVDIRKEQEACVLRVAGENIKGRTDFSIPDNGEEEVWDLKSASPWAFQNKFARGFNAVADNDTFGYVAQGYGYAHALGRKFGGWIAVDKSTGEWAVCETPDKDDQIKREALTDIFQTVKTLEEGKPFERCFDDKPETYRKKYTGNRILDIPCTFCDFKYACWPGLQCLPDVNSEAAGRKLKYYTHIEEKDEEATTDPS